MFSSFYMFMRDRAEFYRYDDEKLPRAPKCIGRVLVGHIIRRRLNRLLPLGHRWRGDVE
jgi:hypothetical protein